MDSGNQSREFANSIFQGDIHEKLCWAQLVFCPQAIPDKAGLGHTSLSALLELLGQDRPGGKPAKCTQGTFARQEPSGVPMGKWQLVQGGILLPAMGS